jgi:putative ABC transport system substrate-binding protein
MSRVAMVDRRGFLKGVGSAAASTLGLALLSGCGVSLSPPVIGARRLGYLDFGPPLNSMTQPHASFGDSQLMFDSGAAFIQGMRDVGWIDGENLRVEYRAASGEMARVSSLLTGLLSLNIQALLVTATPVALLAKQATNAVPIVAVGVRLPVESGLITNLSRPGGNLTALTGDPPGVYGKCIEFLQQMLPELRHLALLTNSANPAYAVSTDEYGRAARQVGIQTDLVDMSTPADLDRVMGAISASGAQAIINNDDNVVGTVSSRFRRLALQRGIPVMMTNPDWVLNGDGILMAYGSRLASIYRRSASYVDRILRGASVGDLPVEQPTVFDLAISVRTAAALGLTVPTSLAAQVTRWAT